VNDQARSKSQLVRELAACRRQVEELKSAKAELERAKREAEERQWMFESLLASLEDVVWAAEVPGSDMVYMNRAAERVYGRPPSAFIGDPDLWHEVVHPDDRKAAARSSEALLEDGNVETTYRVLRPDGEVRWIRDRKVVVHDKDGEPARIGGIASDVTERHEAEDRRRESDEKARRLSEAAFEGIVIHEQGRIAETNQVFARMLGYEPGELVGMDGLQLVAPHFREVVAENIRTDYQRPYEAAMVKKDGTVIPVEFLGKTMANKGKRLRVTAVRDIRNRKRREETIRRQAEEILEISTPTLRVWDGVLAAPLIGTLDSQRSQRFMDALLSAIVKTDAQIALIDITGVPAIDTQTAQHLIETISAVRLLGADVVMTGVRPSIAQTLVHLGIDLSGITTHASLATGLRVALKSIGASL
jgi:PAS domain S-box-containing protein